MRSCAAPTVPVPQRPNAATGENVERSRTRRSHRFTRAGRPQGPALRVNTMVEGDQKAPAISHDAAGSFVVVWESDISNGAGIVARRFAQTGTAASNEFVVESVADGEPKPMEPEIAHLGSAGNFVVVWRDGTLKLGGQRYKP